MWTDPWIWQKEGHLTNTVQLEVKTQEKPPSVMQQSELQTSPADQQNILWLITAQKCRLQVILTLKSGTHSRKIELVNCQSQSKVCFCQSWPDVKRDSDGDDQGCFAVLQLTRNQNGNLRILNPTNGQTTVLQPWTLLIRLLALRHNTRGKAGVITLLRNIRRKSIMIRLIRHYHQLCRMC